MTHDSPGKPEIDNIVDCVRAQINGLIVEMQSHGAGGLQLNTEGGHPLHTQFFTGLALPRHQIPAFGVAHQNPAVRLQGQDQPLDGSEWVQGDTRILANILLHGINGEISVAGATYSGAMPAFQQLGDAELAAVASYIRSAWSNKAEALPATLFEQERKAGSARTTPFEGGAALKALAGNPA